MEIKLVSSLEKCFLDSDLGEFTEYKADKIFKNQTFSFQVAFKADKYVKMYERCDMFVIIESAIAEHIRVDEVVNVPSEIPAVYTCDEGVDRVKAGLFPDLLREPKYIGMIRLASEQTKAVMVTLDSRAVPAGEYQIKARLVKGVYNRGLKATDELLAEDTFTLTVSHVALSENAVNRRVELESTEDIFLNERLMGVGELARTYARTRFLGIQLFKAGLTGVLDKISTRSSRHNKAVLEAKEDVRILEKCAELYSFDEVVASVEAICGTVSVDACLYKPDALMAAMNKVKEMIFAKA